MNLEELRSVQDAERRKSGLQNLRESFYEEAGKYVADLKTERARRAERAEDPFSDPEVGRLTDEIETAEEVVEAIYERRMGKLLTRASLAAADMSADEEGLTAEEKTLFYDLVDRIEANKSTVLDTISGESADRADGDPAATGRESATGREDATGRNDASAPEGAGRRGDATAEEAGRHGVEPGSPPPDAGERPDARPSEAMSAAGAMGGADGSDTGATDAGEPSTDTTDAADPSANDPSAGDPSATDPHEGPPEPPGPDEFLDEADGSPAPARDPGVGPSDRDADGADDAGPTLGDIDDRVTVRITDDVGAIYGVDDREYDLERETVVELPEQNAEPLVERGAAERLE